jgi:tetratricopeptide (TPR) repeat protein
MTKLTAFRESIQAGTPSTHADARYLDWDIKHSEILLTRELKTTKDKQSRIQLLIQRTRLRLRLHHVDAAWEDFAAIQLAQTQADAPTYRQLVLLEADCNLARFETASVGFANRQFLNRSIDLYEWLMSSQDSDEALSWIHYQLGRARMFAMDFFSAAQEFKRSLALPGTGDYPELTAYCYERLGYIEYYEYRNPQLALAYLRRALVTYPDATDDRWRVSVYLLCGRILKETHKIESALDYTKAAFDITLQSDDKALLGEPLLAITEILALTSGNDRYIVDVITRYMHFKRRPPGIDLTWGILNDMLGDAYFNLGQYDNAIEAYRDALFFNPDHLTEANVQFKLGRCYYQLRQYRRVEQCVRRGLSEIDRENFGYAESYLYELLGHACFANGEYDKAITAYEHSIELNTASTTSRIQLQHYLALARSQS